MIKTVQVSELRSDFKAALGHVKKTKEPLVITERGVPTTVLVSIDEYEDYLAARDPKFVASIKAARSEYKAGKTYRFDDVFGNLD